MKIFFHTLILVGLSLASCTDEGASAPIQRIDEIGAFDVGNEGDASDIGVAFSVLNVAGISEFRVFILPSGKSRDFSKEDAFLLTEDRYKTVSLSDNAKFTIRLSGIRDVSGDLIGSNQSYVVKILMIGESFNQLSLIESNPLSIQDQGIYNGYYEGVLVTNVQGQDRFFSDDRESTIVLRGIFSESSSIPDNYIGQFTTEIITTGFGGFQSQFGSSAIRFSLDEGVINSFEADRDLSIYTSTFINCDSTSTGKFPGAIIGTSRMEIIGKECSKGKFKIALERSVQ